MYSTTHPLNPFINFKTDKTEPQSPPSINLHATNTHRPHLTLFTFHIFSHSRNFPLFTSRAT
ncbi:hypothetical protein GBA52_026134 [Prunus armeniaca]|nr:hypothetical protein GBA52_026134 [Prunus armeniaca]